MNDLDLILMQISIISINIGMVTCQTDRAMILLMISWVVFIPSSFYLISLRMI